MGAVTETKERVPDIDSAIRMRIDRAFDSGVHWMLDDAMKAFEASQREQWTKGEIIAELQALRGTKA